MTDQLNFLDIFDRPPPAKKPAEIIILRADRMLGELREAAASILDMPLDRQAAQRQRCLAVFRRRFTAGVPRAALDVAVRDFEKALTSELRRLLILQILAGQRDGAA